MTELSVWRRADVVWLLEHRNDHLPVELRSAAPVGAPGFVGGLDQRGRPVRWLSCPDCLANGRPMAGCETCGGRGEVPDPGPDPYAQNEAVLPIGFKTTSHDDSHERDRKIEMLGRQTRPALTEAELLEEANRRGYAWEEERRAMYRQFDFADLDRALDELRTVDADAAHAVNAVYVDGWFAEVGGEVTEVVDDLCDRGLVFLSGRLPDPLRTGLHPAVTRQQRRRGAGEGAVRRG